MREWSGREHEKRFFFFLLLLLLLMVLEFSGGWSVSFFQFFGSPSGKIIGWVSKVGWNGKGGGHSTPFLGWAW